MKTGYSNLLKQQCYWSFATAHSGLFRFRLGSTLILKLAVIPNQYSVRRQVSLFGSAQLRPELEVDLQDELGDLHAGGPNNEKLLNRSKPSLYFFAALCTFPCLVFRNPMGLRA